MDATEKIDLTDLSFLIPLRVDSLERLENVIIITTYLLHHFKTNIVVCEADRKDTGLLRQYLSDEITILFAEDNDETFHRTKYINDLTFTSNTPLIAVWDADVVVNPQQIVAGVISLRNSEYDFIYPYDGNFMDVGVANRRAFIENIDISFLEENDSSMLALYTTEACGGGFLANKNAYIKTGMENENFNSWGPEDGERLRRWRILGMKIGWVKGSMFHLSHPRGTNSKFRSDDDKAKLLREVDRIGNMTKVEIEDEIRSWQAGRERSQHKSLQ